MDRSNCLIRLRTLARIAGVEEPADVAKVMIDTGSGDSKVEQTLKLLLKLLRGKCWSSSAALKIAQRL